MSPISSGPATGLEALGLEPDTNAPLLEIENLTTYFGVKGGTVHAVDGVSLTVQRRSTLGIVGESGSGKTVLSRSAMGLLRGVHLTQSGQVRYRGHDIVAMSDKQRRRLWGTEMATVFQDPMTSLNPVMKIGNQITESLRYHLGMSRADARETALASLKAVGISAAERRIDEYPHQLSGGMRQRVTIAIALACGPKLLFADEPTTALDVTVQAQILDLLDHEQRERNMGMILVTHDLGVVAGRADTVAVMYAGQIVELAPTKELFDHVRMPYTEALLRAIPKLDKPSHTRLNVISGRPPDLIRPAVGCRFAPRCLYAQPKCYAEPPPLIESETPGHFYRCWFPVNTPGKPQPEITQPLGAPSGAAKLDKGGSSKAANSSGGKAKSGNVKPGNNKSGNDKSGNDNVSKKTTQHQSPPPKAPGSTVTPVAPRDDDEPKEDVRP